MKLPTLYTKTSKNVLNCWEISTDGATVTTMWGPVDGLKQTNSYRAKGKNTGRSNQTTPEEQAALEAKSRWDKQVRLKYRETPDAADEDLNIKPMRAYVLDEKRAKKLLWPVYVQPKLNGVRCMAYVKGDGAVRLVSRGGKDYTVPHVQQELKNRIPKNTMLDGELYIHGTSLQTARHLQAQKSPELKFHVYDITALPTDNTTWQKRLHALHQWFQDNPNLEHVFLTDTVLANTMGTVKKIHADLTAKGYEGVMVRTVEGPYKLAGKSVDLLKYKMFVDAEFKVVGWKKGKDEVPLFVCIQEEGLEFDVRPVGTAEERRNMLSVADSYVGQLLTVKYQDRSDTNIPLFPVGISLRPPEDLD